MSWWWLSFVHADKPEGERFAGGCIVEGDCMEAAIKRAWQLGINPGGEVEGFEVPAEFKAQVERIGPNRLFSKAELNDMGEFSDYDRAKQH